MWKSITTLCLAFVATVIFSTTVYANRWIMSDVGYPVAFVNGEEMVITGTLPTIRDNSMYLPMDFLAEAIGGDWIFDAREGKITITLDMPTFIWWDEDVGDFEFEWVFDQAVVTQFANNLEEILMRIEAARQAGPIHNVISIEGIIEGLGGRFVSDAAFAFEVIGRRQFEFWLDSGNANINGFPIDIWRGFPTMIGGNVMLSDEVLGTMLLRVYADWDINQNSGWIFVMHETQELSEMELAVINIVYEMMSPSVQSPQITQPTPPATQTPPSTAQPSTSDNIRITVNVPGGRGVALRVGPGGGYDVAHEALNGTVLEATGNSSSDGLDGAWVEVRFDGRLLYVHSNFVSDEWRRGGAPTPPPTTQTPPARQARTLQEMSIVELEGELGIALMYMDVMGMIVGGRNTREFQDWSQRAAEIRAELARRR